MVIIKGEIKTSEIMPCVYSRNTQKWDENSISQAYRLLKKMSDVFCQLKI